jgi:hypothetical protein
LRLFGFELLVYFRYLETLSKHRTPKRFPGRVPIQSTNATTSFEDQTVRRLKKAVQYVNFVPGKFQQSHATQFVCLHTPALRPELLAAANPIDDRLEMARDNDLLTSTVNYTPVMPIQLRRLQAQRDSSAIDIREYQTAPKTRARTMSPKLRRNIIQKSVIVTETGPSRTTVPQVLLHIELLFDIEMPALLQPSVDRSHKYAHPSSSRVA